MSDEVKTPEDVKESNVVQLFEDLKPAEHPDGLELTEYVYTNDLQNPMLPRMFHFLYDATFKNKIGVMHALNKETKKVHTIIVGVEITEDGMVACMPIAKVLTAEEQDQYCAPDGMGGFVGYEPEQSE